MPAAYLLQEQILLGIINSFALGRFLNVLHWDRQGALELKNIAKEADHKARVLSSPWTCSHLYPSP